MKLCDTCCSTGIVFLCPDDCEGDCDLDPILCPDCDGKGVVADPDRRN